jgi:hypothetical protein
MADKRISQLVVVTAPNVDDVLPIVNGGVTKQVSVDNLVANSTYSTKNVDDLPLIGNAATSDFLLVNQNGVPVKIAIGDTQPVVLDTDTIDLSFNGGTRVLAASVKPGSVGTVHLSAGAVTADKIDPNAKIGGATGGGSDRFIYENDQVVTTDYTITAGKNAMSAGPITINNGVTLTVPNGSTYTVV